MRTLSKILLIVTLIWVVIASTTSCSKPGTRHNREFRQTELQFMSKNGDTLQYHISEMPKVFTQDSVLTHWPEFQKMNLVRWRGGETNGGNRYANFWLVSHNYVANNWFSAMLEFTNGTRWLILYSRPNSHNYPFQFGRLNVDGIAEDLVTAEGIAEFSIIEFQPGRQLGFDVAEGTGSVSDDPHILWTIDTLKE